MARNGYNPHNRAGESFKGSHHNPQPVEFSSAEGFRSIDILSAEPGVAEGVSTVAANGPFRADSDHVDKGT